MQTTQDSGAATSDDDVEAGIDHDDPTRADLYAVSEFLGIASLCENRLGAFAEAHLIAGAVKDQGCRRNPPGGL